MSDLPNYGDQRRRGPNQQQQPDLYQFSGEQGQNMPGQGNLSMPDLYSYTGEGNVPAGPQGGPDLYGYSGDQGGARGPGSDLYAYSGDQGPQQGDPFANDRMPGRPSYSDQHVAADGTIIINNYYCRDAVINQNGGADYRTNPQYDFRQYTPEYITQQQMNRSSYYPEDYMATPQWQQGVQQGDIVQGQMYANTQSELARQQAMMNCYNRAFNPDMQNMDMPGYQYSYPPGYRYPSNSSMGEHCPNYFRQGHHNMGRGYYANNGNGFYPESTSVMVGPAGATVMRNPEYPPSPDVAASMGNVNAVMSTIYPLVNAGAGIYMGIRNQQNYQNYQHHRRFY
ncbi:MAG TPA: hypothetical protein V6C72_17270 [Chroococcales cyanobacterium]